jgi:hypothetical protein
MAARLEARLVLDHRAAIGLVGGDRAFGARAPAITTRDGNGGEPNKSYDHE